LGERVKKLKEKLYEDEFSMVFKDDPTLRIANPPDSIKISRPPRNLPTTKPPTKPMKDESSSDGSVGGMGALLRDDSSSMLSNKYPSSKRKRPAFHQDPDDDEEPVSDSDSEKPPAKQENLKRLRVEPPPAKNLAQKRAVSQTVLKPLEGTRTFPNFKPFKKGK